MGKSTLCSAIKEGLKESERGTAFISSREFWEAFTEDAHVIDLEAFRGHSMEFGLYSGDEAISERFQRR